MWKVVTVTTNAFSPGFIGRVAERRRGVHVCLGVSHLRHLVALRLSQSELLTLGSPEWTVTEHLCKCVTRIEYRLQRLHYALTYVLC